MLEERLPVEFQPTVTGDVIHAITRLANAKMDLHGPALKAQEFKKYQRPQQADAVTLKNAISQKGIDESPGLEEFFPALANVRDSRVDLTQEVRHAEISYLPRQQD
jgi:hypothetical protein